MKYPFVIETRQGSQGEDRANFFRTNNGFVAIVADGAGGMGGGAEAATDLCDLVGSTVVTPPKCWAGFLITADAVLSRSATGGQATVVVVEAKDGYLVGASVGDSGALLFSGDLVVELTAAQRRKPLLGSGVADPVSFGPILFDGRLLLASDGILKYLSFAKMIEIIKNPSLQSTALDLVEAAKLPNGSFHDDVAVLLCDSVG
jgi:serine/threonine protein phosphatase PrpC